MGKNLAVSVLALAYFEVATIKLCVSRRTNDCRTKAFELFGGTRLTVKSGRRQQRPGLRSLLPTVPKAASRPDPSRNLQMCRHMDSRTVSLPRCNGRTCLRPSTSPGPTEPAGILSSKMKARRLRAQLHREGFELEGGSVGTRTPSSVLACGCTPALEVPAA